MTTKIYQIITNRNVYYTLQEPLNITNSVLTVWEIVIDLPEFITPNRELNYVTINDTIYYTINTFFQIGGELFMTYYNDNGDRELHTVDVINTKMLYMI